MRSYKHIFWGLVLIAVGVVFALNALEITNIKIFFKGWWTLLIIIPSLVNLFVEGRDDAIGNIIGILIGVFLLLGVRNIIDFDIILKLIFPIILVLVGLSLLFKNTIKKVNIPKSNNTREYFATFSSQNIDGGATFTGADVNAVFGNLELDCRDSRIKKDSVINSSSIFGKVTVIVPENYQVIVKSVSIFGSVNNKCNKNDGSKEILYIECLCLFGGIDIYGKDSKNN